MLGAIPAPRPSSSTTPMLNRLSTSAASKSPPALLCGMDAGCRSPDTSTWTRAHVLAEHDLLISSVDWSPVNNKIVTCSHDRNAFVWTYQVRHLSPRAPHLHPTRYNPRIKIGKLTSTFLPSSLSSTPLSPRSGPGNRPSPFCGSTGRPWMSSGAPMGPSSRLPQGPRLCPCATTSRTM
jgi:WD40 repeat protein